MASETMNHDLLIATAKTPHKVLSDGPSDIIIDPSGKPLPGTNWDDTKKLRKAGPCANTLNTFIDGAVIFIKDGRIDAGSQSSHPVAGPGKSSGSFRGDTSAMKGSPDLFKEKRATMRTSDLTRHNCFPPTGPSNTTGKVLVNLAATDLTAQLRGQITKLCTIIEKDDKGVFLTFGKCAHGRSIPNGGQLEVVKSSNAPLIGKMLGDDPEKLSFVVTRKDTTIAPSGAAKCQQPGEHASWTAHWGSAAARNKKMSLLKAEKGVDKFEVEVPGFATPAITGVLPAIKWLLDTMGGPNVLTVTATSCSSSRTAVVRCYPNGKLSVNFAQEIQTFRKRFEAFNRIANFVVAFSRALNGGKVGSMTFELLPGNCELSFECEFKERTKPGSEHLVGADWKATFGFNPLLKLEFKWPVPIEVFLGPFGAVARGAQWIADWVGLRGSFNVGFKVEAIIAGTISRDPDGKVSPGLEGEVAFGPNCELALERGPSGAPTHKIAVQLSITGSFKWKLRPDDSGQGAIKCEPTFEVQVGFTIEYTKTGSGTTKLVDYKPEWAKYENKGTPFIVL